ncbi:PAS domain-containing protein [Mucilaginibacter sp. NFR10]|uniref:PAS domain-containing protein n=1 Tax=Mucilaginibacter sp. NFR10 TaxID=1566292 RepID=UPI000B82CD74
MSLKAVIQHVIDGIIIIDKTGEVIYTNPAADESFGYKPQRWRLFRNEISG